MVPRERLHFVVMMIILYADCKVRVTQTLVLCKMHMPIGAFSLIAPNARTGSIKRLF
jgi:hypothetical protein